MAAARKNTAAWKALTETEGGTFVVDGKLVLLSGWGVNVIQESPTFGALIVRVSSAPLLPARDGYMLLSGTPLAMSECAACKWPFAAAATR